VYKIILNSTQSQKARCILARSHRDCHWYYYY